MQAYRWFTFVRLFLYFSEYKQKSEQITQIDADIRNLVAQFPRQTWPHFQITFGLCLAIIRIDD